MHANAGVAAVALASCRRPYFFSRTIQTDLIEFYQQFRRAYRVRRPSLIWSTRRSSPALLSLNGPRIDG